jgi:hypothetical protein
MTVVAADAAESAWVETRMDGLDPDADVGFWSMSPASAEQVTVQIRTVLDRAWEFIALAYKGRAFIALGYPNWDAYVDARFGDLRIAVPREHRTQVVAELAGVRMSCRAIAKVLGVGVATVHRELARSIPTGPSDPAVGGGSNAGVIGRDGKEYPRTRRTELAAAPCSTCGEHHPEQTGECPWDLFAQGRAPHPRGASTLEPSPGEETTYAAAHRTDVQAGGRQRKNTVTGPVEPTSGTGFAGKAVPLGGLDAVVGFVGQLEAALEEVSGLGDVVRAIEDASADLAGQDRDRAVEARVRRLSDDLGAEAAGWPSLVVRLGLVADALRPSS